LIETGLVVIGALEAISSSLAGGAGVVGLLGAGFVMSTLLEESIVDENYHEVLNFIVRELWKKINEKRKVKQM